MPVTGEQLRRKLAVILASDVAGYSALMATDEERTVRRYAEVSRIMHTMVAKQAGRVFNTAGDAILAEFDSAVNAVRCAIDVQEAVNARDATEPSAGRLKLRIGIAIGDVIVADNGDLLGDGVNIAARLESIAPPGGICISRDVLNLVQSKIGLGFDDLGLQELKHIAQPVHAYRIAAKGDRNTRADAGANHRRHLPWKTLAASGIVGLALLAGVAVLKQTVPARIAAWETFDATRVPLISDAAREQLRLGYAVGSGHKALAISNDGEFVGALMQGTSNDDAAIRALELCQKDSTSANRGQRPCFIYAIGNRVQLDPARIPMPRPSEIARRPTEETLRPDDPAMQRMNQGQRLLRDYPTEKRPKALAIGTRGEAVWGAMATGATDTEAIRRALEFCGLRAGGGGRNADGGTGAGAAASSAGDAGASPGGPCILYALNDDLVTLAPRSRKIIGALVISADRNIPDAQRDALINAYADGDWQAMARGRSGTWHAVSGYASEAIASAVVLKNCRAADTECQIYAIGRFLVAPGAN